MDVSHRFDDASYDRLNAAGIPWQTVQAVLHAHPQVRRHIGSVLNVAAPVTDWVTSEQTWLVVALIEEDDDEYLVVSARHLSGDEIVAVRKMLEGGV